MNITTDMIRRAVADAAAGPSSDFDLNPGGRPTPANPRPAAVLCALVDRGDGLRVILTERAAHLKHHAGQISFPGGKRDPEDPSLSHTALREAEEEIGLTGVDLIGPLDGHETVTGFRVTPYIGVAPPDFAPRPDPGEVADVFEPPLTFLMDPANRRRDWRMWNGGRRYFYAMPWEGRYIWGATARMLVGLSDRLAAVGAAPGRRPQDIPEGEEYRPPYEGRVR